MLRRTPQRFDGIYRSSVRLIANTWKNHPFRIPILMIVFLLSLTVSAGILVPPQSPVNQSTERAKANTYQFVPTAGNLVTGTEQNANSGAAAAAEGINTGSWKGTLADDNLHWQVTAADSGTPNLNMQLDLGTARLANANKLIIATEVDLDSASRTLKIQICDWVSSTSVDAAADGQCTTGGWRSLMSQTAANADVDIALTTGAAFQWHIFDGYFTTGTTGGTAISTPLTNFTSSDTQPIRIRYWSDADVVGTGDVAVDFLRAHAFVDSVYHPAGAVNQNVSSGALAGTYANAHVVGNSATAQQSVTAGNAVYLTGAGTAGSVADFYLQFKNVKPYTGSNAFYFKADYSCSAATAGLDHKFSLYNFATTTWVDFNSAVIACATGDATNGWSIDSITPADFIDESASDEVRVRFLGDLNSTTTLRIDFAYLMLGSVNADTSLCEITWGSGTATNCSNTRTLNTPAGTSYFNNTAEDRSVTADNDYYPTDCVANATATEECAAANISFPVTVPTDGQVVVNHFASRHRGQLNSTNPDLLVTAGLRDYSGTPTSTAATGGWTTVGPASTAGAFAYGDSIINLAIGTYGNQVNPDDHVDTVNNRMNMRLRTSTNGADAVNNIVEWDFAFVSIGWVVDSSHPTRNYQFAPTSHTLATGTQPARNAEVAASAEGVNTGGFKGVLGDDNMHWMVTGANVVGTNYDAQLNFASAKQNGANKLIVQAAVDLDAALAMVVQICDWVSTTSVDNAADANCTGGGWRTINSQNGSNADVALTTTTNDTSLQWHIYDGYFTTGTTGGSPVSTPLRYFFDTTNGIKIRFFSTVQSTTDIAIDFVRVQPIIDTVYHPASVTNLNGSGGALANTYANAHVVGNTTTAQQSVTAGDAVYLTGAGTAGSIADYYLSFTNIKTYTGANTIYFKADYSCSAATAGLDTEFAIYNFTSAAWEDLTTAAIACSTTDATHGWAKNNVTLTNYINGGETRIRYYGDLNSTTTLRLDFAYIVLGSTNDSTADCQVTFGTGTATNCTNTRDLVGPATATTFDNPAEDESTTMGTGDSNAFYAFDNESTPDATVEESTSANISFPVTQPANSSVVGQNYALRFNGCSVCTTQALTTNPGFKDYSGFNAATGGWLQLTATANSATQVYTDTITAMTVAAYGQQVNPEDYIDTANNKVSIRLRPTTPGTSTNNATTAWDFAMVSIQWIEIGNTIDIGGSSSVASSTVAVAVDGLLQVGKTATAAGGSCPCAWTISSVFVAGDRPVLVWHDGASDANESSGMTVYDGGGNITGMQLTAATFSVGSVDDQNVDSADLIKFDNDADEDVMYKFVTTTLTVDATSAYASDTLDVLSGDTLTIGGSETMLAYNTTINGTLTSGGATTYTIQGDWENNGTFNEGTSTVTMNGTTSENLDSGCSNTDSCTAENFYNLTINKTDASSSNDNLTLTNFGIRVTNTLTLTDGELIQGTFNVRVEGSSAVSVAAAGTWTNISTGDLKLGGTFVNNGAVTFNSNNGTQCVDAADDIVINSTNGGSQRTWSGSGTETIYNVSVTDMADSSVTAYTSAFSNTTWTVGSCGISITGSCDQYDQTTDCTDDGSNQFRVAVNGSIQAQVDTTVDGTINITGVTAPATGDIITVFIDDEATDAEEAVAVTKYDGTGDVTGVVLYWRHLTIGSGDNQTLANADIDAYDNSVSADEDIFFEVNGTDDLTVDTLTSYTDEELYIVAGNTYRPASAGGADASTVHVEIDGTWTADSNTATVDGNWQNDGTFTANTGVVNFTSASGGRTLSGTMTGATGKFNDIVFNNVGGAWGLSGAIEAGNDFTVTNGAVTTNNNTVTVGRDFTLTNNIGTLFTAGSSTINVVRHFNDSAGTKFVEDNSTVNQTGTGTITVGNGGDFNNLSVGYSSFTTTFSNNNWDMFGTLTFNGGTVSGGGSYISLRRTTTGTSVVFASATTLSGTQTIYHVGAAGSITYTIAGGNYGTWGVVPYSAFSSNTYTLGGDFSSTAYLRLEADNGLTGNAFNTGTNRTITTGYIQIAPCAPTRTGSWAIDFNDSTVALSSTTNALYVGTNCGSHTLDLDTSDVTVNGSVSFVDGTTSVAVTPGSSDFTFAPTASQTETYASNGQSLWNMTINGANGAATIQPTSAVDVNNNFTITAGTYDTVSGSNWGLTIGGNYSNSATFTARNGTVTFDATDPSNTVQGTLSGSSAFYNLTFNGSGGDWTPNAALAVTNDLTMTAGSLLGTQNVTVNGHVQGTAGIINLTAGTFEQRLNNTGGLTKNFGTTSGSNAWTFSSLTFSNGCSICTDAVINTQTGGTGGINVTDILRAGKSGDTDNLILNAGNRTWTLSGTGGDPFQILASPAGDLGPGTSTFTFTGNNGGGDTTVQSETYNNLIVNNGSETYNAEGTTIAVDVTVTAGTLAMGSNILTVNDDLLIDGTLSGTGNVQVRDNATGSGTLTLTGGTFYFDNTSDSGSDFGTTSGSNAWTFFNLSFTNSIGIAAPQTYTTQTGGTGGITVTNTLRVGDVLDGEATILNAGNRTWTLSGTTGNPFDIEATLSSDLAPATSTFAYTGNNSGGDTTVQSETYNNLTVNNGSETYNLEAATSAAATTITAGTLALNGFNLTSAGDLTVNGTLSGTANVIANAEVTGSGTITLSGSSSFTQRIVSNNNYSFGSSSGSNNWTFNNLTIRNSDTNNHTVTARATGSGQIIVNGIFSIGSASDSNNLTFDNNTNDRILDINGSVDITSRGVLQASNSASFTVGDNWTNSNTFTHNNGTVTFDTTTTATFAGATTFYNFTSTTAAKTLEFTAGQTFTIDTGGLLTLTGAADPNEIQIKSTSSSQWFINHQGTESVDYVQVINSGCDGASTQISTTNSVNDGNNGTCWLFGSTFEQADYRFGEEPEDSSTDSSYAGMPAENTAYSTSGTGDVFRLRMLLHVGGSNLAQNGETFKLQFGEKTAATCTSGVSWGDVSPSAGVIRYSDGAPADGDNITSVAGDPDHSGHTKQYQDYEEANNFTNSVSAINSGQDGVWSFSLVNHSAIGGKRYCFKAVKSTGTDLDTYSFYPEVIIDEELIFTLDSTSKTFGVVTPGGNPTDVSSTLTTSTNSSTGYVIYAWATQVMTKGSDTLADWTGTNASPTTFGNGSFGFGYTTDDSSLTGGTANRFTNGGAKYAGFTHTGPGDPVADRTSGPVTAVNDVITYRLAASTTQAAGTYSTVIVYVCSVTF